MQEISGDKSTVRGRQGDLGRMGRIEKREYGYDTHGGFIKGWRKGGAPRRSCHRVGGLLRT